MRNHLIIVFLLTAICPAINGQQYIEDSLLRSVNSSRSEVEKIKNLERLSDYYYANKNFTAGDSLIEKQIMLAESTLDRQQVLRALFANAGYRSTGASTKDRSNNTKSYIERALDYAKANNLTDYIALAYSNMAALNVVEGNLNGALSNASLSFTTALNSENDSAKVICAIQLGDVYLQKSDILTAFKTYTNAHNIAVKQKDEALLPPVFHAIANLYKKLGKDEDAKTYLYRSLIINKRNNNIKAQTDDHIFLAKVSDYAPAKEHLQQAIELADSTHDVLQKIDAEKILFSYMLLKEKPSFTIAYLDAKPELKNVFVNTGPDYIDWMLAEIYLYGGMPDSAAFHFKKAENSFNIGYDLTSKKNFFGEFADCMEQLKDIPTAITYYQKSLELSRAASDLNNLKYFSYTLKNLYQLQGDYKLALAYNIQYDNYKDSVDLLGKEKDLALLEIDNETKQQQRKVELALQHLQRKYNLQYMLITIIVATAFVIMLMIGMFKVSTFTIRLMGFLSLIFLFEFIILILDTRIHHMTHGEPWKVWLIKIGIISILLPVHHFLEHKLIHYLLSRHLIKIRGRFSPARLFGRKKSPLTKLGSEEESNQSIEEKN